MIPVAEDKSDRKLLKQISRLSRVFSRLRDIQKQLDKRDDKKLPITKERLYSRMLESTFKHMRLVKWSVNEKNYNYEAIAYASRAVLEMSLTAAYLHSDEQEFKLYTQYEQYAVMLKLFFAISQFPDAERVFPNDRVDKIIEASRQRLRKSTDDHPHFAGRRINLKYAAGKLAVSNYHQLSTILSHWVHPNPAILIGEFESTEVFDKRVSCFLLARLNEIIEEFERFLNEYLKRTEPPVDN